MKEFLIVLFVIGALGACFASWVEGRHESPRLGTDGFPLCNFDLQVGRE